MNNLPRDERIEGNLTKMFRTHVEFPREIFNTRKWCHEFFVTSNF